MTFGSIFAWRRQPDTSDDGEPANLLPRRPGAPLLGHPSECTCRDDPNAHISDLADEYARQVRRRS